MTHAILGAHGWAEWRPNPWRPNPCILGDPLKRGGKSQLASLPMTSWGHTAWRNYYGTPLFLGVAIKGDKIRSGFITHAFLGTRTWANCDVTTVFSGVPRKRGQNQK